MYKVKIIEKGKKRNYVKTIDFIGEFTEEVRQQWERIKKHAKNNVTFEYLPYLSKGGESEQK